MRRINLSPRTWRMGTTLAVSVVLLFGFLLSIALLTYNVMLRERRASEVESAVVVARSMAAQVDRLLADIEGTTFTAALFLGGTSSVDQAHTGAYLKSRPSPMANWSFASGIGGSGAPRVAPIEGGGWG